MDADEKSKYFCRTKFMNNYTFMFQDELKALMGNDSKTAKDTKMNIEGRYIKSNFEANKKFTSHAAMKAQLEQGIQLWDIACIRDRKDEDNDTDGEEDS